MKPLSHQHILESLSQPLIEQGYFVRDDLFLPDIISNLLQFAHQKYEYGEFKKAAIGRQLKKTKIDSIRGDEIQWIENWSEAESLNTYGLFLQQFLDALRVSLRIPLKRFEGHFAYYPIGKHYVRHIDQHAKTQHRQVTCILYLSDWKPENQGELVMYLPNGGSLEVAPKAGRFVCFLSGLIPHEVKTTQAPRWSITSWMRDDLVDFLPF